MTAPELSPTERVVVARFGLDRPEGLDLDVIEARANASTPGPWHGLGTAGGPTVFDDDLGGAGRPFIALADDTQGERDCQFIAAARDDVPALVVEVRAHRDRAARIRALEVEARDEYEALRADESAPVSDLVGAEARVVALAAAADIAEGKAF